MAGRKLGEARESQRIPPAGVWRLVAALLCASCGPAVNLDPLVHSVAGVSCSDTRLEFLEHELADDPKQPSYAYFSIVDVATQTRTREPIGRGSVMEPVAHFGATIVAALYEYSIEEGGQRDRHTLVRTRDRGLTWQSLDSAPSDVVGVAFADESHGWSWSDRALWLTQDGGESWKPLEIPKGRFPRSGALPIVVGTDLWAALSHGVGHRGGDNALLRIRRNGEVRVVRANDPFSLAVLVHDGGSLWGLTDIPEGQGVSLLYRIDANDRGTISQVSTLPHGRPHYLSVRGDRVVAAASGPWVEGGRTTLFRSADGGKTWAQRTQWGHEKAFCETPEGKLWRITLRGVDAID